MIMTTKMKTEAASMISCYDHKKKYDMYCKKLLSNKQILAYVMKGCIPEYADIPLEDIPSYIEMSSINTAECECIDDYQVESRMKPYRVHRSNTIFSSRRQYP